MLDDDFIGVNDSCEVSGLIPLNEMGEVSQELLRLGLFDYQSEILCGTNNEFAQFKLMFHVEQLRESAGEVKTFQGEKLKSLCLPV